MTQIEKSDMHVDVPYSRPPLPMPGQDLFVWAEHLDRKRKTDYYSMHIFKVMPPALKIYSKKNMVLNIRPMINDLCSIFVQEVR